MTQDSHRDRILLFFTSSAQPPQQIMTPQTSYTCKMCRQLLFRQSEIMIHEEGQGQEAFKYTKRSV